MDFSNVTFNKHHKREASAKDASTALKLLLLSFATSLLLMGVAAAVSPAQASGVVFMVAAIAVGLLSFAAGGYGAYLAASALNWASYITVGVVICALIPYMKLLLFIVLAVFSINLIREAGFVFSLFGPLRKRQSS